MEVAPDANRMKANTDLQIPPALSNGNKRRLSVSIVESEGRRHEGTDLLLSDHHWRNTRDDSTNGGSNHDREHLTKIHEMMTQDCIEWDEGRHNSVDLRKLADPNFQTPSTLGIVHPSLLPTTTESVTPTKKGSSSLRLSSGSITSHCDSQSPVPPRRRQRRRRESLDLIVRHIPTKSLNNPNSVIIPQDNDQESRTSAADPAATIVSTEKYATRRHDQKQSENTTPLVTSTLQDVTNHFHHTSSGKVGSAIRDGTTDFADLIHKIQTKNVSVLDNQNTVCTDKKIEGYPNQLSFEMQQDENRMHQNSPVLVSVVHKFPLNETAALHRGKHTVGNIIQNQAVAATYESKIHVDHDTEFDDVTFSSDDLAAIDAFVDTALPPETNMSNATEERSDKTSTNDSFKAKINETVPDEDCDPFGDIPDIDIDALLKGTHNKSTVTAAPDPKDALPKVGTEIVLKPTASSTGNKNQLFSPSQNKEVLKSNTGQTKVSADDQFDDLPDFDVDAFVSKQEFILPTMSCTADDDDDEFPDVDFDALDFNIGAVPNTSEPPLSNAPVRNRRQLVMADSDTNFLACSRYKVLDVNEDAVTYTKTVTLAEWNSDMLKDEDEKTRLIHHPSDQKRSYIDSRDKWKVTGVIYLRGEWYYTRLATDDTIHIVSLSGRFCTDQLPIIFHTCPPKDSDADDDLLLIVHPDLLLTPTIISETVGCSRRAVLKNRLGATGLTSKAALDGTMRHALFEATMKTKDFSSDAALAQIKSIVRENAESLLACNISSREAEREIVKFLPQLRRFANEYTTFGSGTESQDAYLESHGAAKSSLFIAKSVEAVEEPVISPELGLKGNVDMLVTAISRTENQIQSSPSLMGIELKTGHHQNAQNIHVAQLALYVIMLQTRFALTSTNKDQNKSTLMKSGVLLYMNNDAIRAIHIAPIISEIKSLIGMRNLVAIETIRSQRPRGILLTYEENNDAESSHATVKVDTLGTIPPELPDLLPNSFSCKKCYSNRECMMYAAASHNALQVAGLHDSHRDLLQHFTSHLVKEEYAYFTKWDRLIDLEADASSSLIARSWLRESKALENESTSCISSLIFDPATSSSDAVFDESWFASIGFRRCPLSPIQTHLSDVGFEPGCRVVVSTDSQSIRPSNPSTVGVRHQMHLVRGSVHKVSNSHIHILAARDDLHRIENSVKYTPASSTFRLDKENLPTGITTLRQNLVNLFTADKKPQDTPGSQVEQSRLSWLRDVLIRLRRPIFDRSMIKYMFEPMSGMATEAVPGCDLMDLRSEFSNLNQDQQAAVQQVFAAQDYTLVQGLPGSGKTSTIAFVARLLAAHGKRVLITSYTHAAVDNVLLKLIECGVSTEGHNGHALIRVGKKASCHVGVHATFASTIALQLETGLNTQDKQHTVPSPEYLRIAMSNARIVGVTALTIPRSSLLFREQFDVVIVDEAGQISQPAIIGALLAADSFILVGDHMQLPPLVVSELAGKAEYGESMLKRLAEKHPDCVSQLTYQYRMHEDICQLSNDIVYKGKLKCANDQVAKKVLKLDHYPVALNNCGSTESFLWLTGAIDPSKAVTFLDTDKINNKSIDSKEESACFLESSNNGRSGGSIVNETEAFIVKCLIEGLMKCGLDASAVGIISPFRAQLRVLDEDESIRKWISEGLEVSTIDRFQGRDKSVIILSFVRSNSKGKVGHLLEDFRRLNVAVTRAKYKLIMVGSYSTLYKGSDVLKLVLDRVTIQNHLIQLPSNTSIPRIPGIKIN